MRRYWGMLLLLGVGTLLAGAVWSGGAGASAGPGKPGAPLSLPTPTLTLTPPPLTGCLVSAPSGIEGHFYAVSASGPNDVWAVGGVHGLSDQSLMAHWDGTHWATVASAAPAGWALGDLLTGVVALAPNDVWAVGDGGGPLIIHWDGSQWTPVSAPNVGSLRVLAAAASNDIWAVGTQMVHWDGRQWSFVPHPAGGTLRAVAARSATDAWAVGSSDLMQRSVTHIEHWDGSQWTVVPSPNLGQLDSTLSGVTSLAANDAWAVGNASNGSVTQALTLHWDGATWRIVPVPRVGDGNNTLAGVVALGPNDVWAAGTYDSIRNPQPLVLHWDGARWSYVAAPRTGWQDNVINGLTAAGPNSVWMVGDYNEASQRNLTKGLALHYVAPCPPPPPPPPCQDGFHIILSPNPALRAVAAVAADDVWAVGGAIIHWDGLSWSRVPAPAGSLYDIAALAADDIWAVGEQSGGPSTQAQALHWDGATWTPVPLPVLGDPSSLRSVAAIGPHDVWAVGSAQSGPANAVILHWDGTTWQVVPSPAAPAAGDTTLNAVAAGAANDVWAVGQQGNSSLILHRVGLSWAVVAHPAMYSLRAVAVAGSDVWFGGQTSAYQAGLLHWDGQAWSTQTFPDGYEIRDLQALSPQNVWAAGTTGLGGRYLLAWATRWDGADWLPVDSEDITIYNNSLAGLALAAPNNVWAVGNAPGGGMVQHYTGPCVSPTPITPTPTPTSTPCTLVQPLNEGFEGGTLGAFYDAATPGWTPVTTSAHGGQYAAFAPDAGYPLDQQLTLAAPISAPPGTQSAVLTFWHHYLFNGYTGAVLEVSTDGGAHWLDAGADIISGRYNGVIDNCCGNPLGGRPGWINNNGSSSFTPVTVNLLPYLAQPVRFRLRLGRSGNSPYPGWWVDDVSVTLGITACLIPTPTPTATPVNTHPKR